MVQSVFICKDMQNRYLIVACLCFLSLSVFSQKKNKYDLYWEQQAIEEKKKEWCDSAHKAFKTGDLQLALDLYQKALDVKPEDQFVKAKIQDLDILNREIKAIINKMGTSNKLDLNNSMPELDLVYSIRNAENESLEEAEDTLREAISEPLEQVIESSEPEVITSEPQELEEEVVRTKEVSPVEEVVLSDELFDLSTFRLNLAKSFPQGFTEEEYRQGRKVITRRVVVKEHLGDEYLRVKHDYGAVFYFKNKQSTSVNVWLKETENKMNENK